MKSSLPVTCIIPTYTNTIGLFTLIGMISKAHIPIIIVDNSPSSEKKDFCIKYRVIYLPQNKNRGFAGAVNLGMKHVQTDWACIMNDDIEIQEVGKCMDQLFDYAESHSYCAVSPVLMNAKGLIENRGYFVLPQGKAVLNFDVSKSFCPPGIYKDASFIRDSGKTHIDGLTAACLLINRHIFIDIGGFDESFFAYLEDIDLFLRLKQNGYGFGIDNGISVMHKHSTTSKLMGKMKQKRDFQNWFRVITKNWDIVSKIRYFVPIAIERMRNLKGVLIS